MKLLVPLLFLGTIAFNAGTAQVPVVAISGTVTDAETGESLPGAHVFIATSMIGTTTNDDGAYVLEGIPVGALRLFVSILGYESEARDILLKTDTPRTIDFKLQPAIIEVGEVVVEAKRDKKWRQRLERFERLFIGETPFASETKIVNPEVLDFDVDRAVFKAVAAEPLVIENRALGYRIQYFLKEFEADRFRTRYDGEPLFEELETTDPEEAERWRLNRRAAFIGSFRHFALALLAGKTEEQRFATFGRTSVAAPEGMGGGGPQMGSRFPVDAASIFRDGDSSNEYVFDFEGFVEIIFTGELEDESYLRWSGNSRGGGGRPGGQTSWIRLERGPTVFDYKGDVLDPYGVTFYGYLAFERVGDIVPREYRPS